MASTATAKAKRFELPELARLDPLTAGTNLPAPPPDSPVEKAAPPALSGRATAAAGTSTNGKGSNSATQGLTPSSYSSGSLGRTAAGDTSDSSSPTSPVSPKRPSSIRRFLSHRSLRSRYSNQSQESLAATLSPGKLRPDTSVGSYTTASGPTTTSRAAKRSSSWFGRFSSMTPMASENKRASIVYEDKLVVKSPPPRLSDFGRLQTKIEAGNMGADDMFKNIK